MSNFTTYVVRGFAKPEKKKGARRKSLKKKPVGRVANAPKERKRYLLLGYLHF